MEEDVHVPRAGGCGMSSEHHEHVCELRLVAGPGANGLWDGSSKTHRILHRWEERDGEARCRRCGKVDDIGVLMEFEEILRVGGFEGFER